VDRHAGIGARGRRSSALAAAVDFLVAWRRGVTQSPAIPVPTEVLTLLATPDRLDTEQKGKDVQIDSDDFLVDSDDFLDWLETIPCDLCGKTEWELVFLPQWVAKPFGTFSLSGSQMKMTMVETPWPYLVCECGRVCKGKE
jgi:hypothetical protein